MTAEQGDPRYAPIALASDGRFVVGPCRLTSAEWEHPGVLAWERRWRRWVRALDRTERRSTIHAVVLALLAAYRRLHERLRGVTAITLARRPVPRAEAPPGREHGADTRRANGPPARSRDGPPLGYLVRR